MIIYLIIILISPVIFFTNVILSNFFINLDIRINYFIGIFVYIICQFLILFFYFFSILSSSYYLAIISLNILIFLGYFELLSMLSRGFSLQIITDVYKKKLVNSNNIHEIYSEDRGINWLLEKRLDTLKKVGLLKIKDKNLSINGKFNFYLIYLSIVLKNLFSIGRGGE